MQDTVGVDSVSIPTPSVAYLWSTQTAPPILCSPDGLERREGDRGSKIHAVRKEGKEEGGREATYHEISQSLINFLRHHIER